MSACASNTMSPKCYPPPDSPLPTTARVGREQQRYEEDGARIIAGTVPVRRVAAAAAGGAAAAAAPSSGSQDQHHHSMDGGSSGGGTQYQVLLVSSRNGKGFGLPKGGWEVDETVEEAASRETAEEAGVRGALEELPLGVFSFKSGKPGLHQGHCRAHMFVMHVTEVLDAWPESERQRIWCSVAEASQLCRHHWMREALQAWSAREGGKVGGGAGHASGSVPGPGRRMSTSFSVDTSSSEGQ